MLATAWWQEFLTFPPCGLGRVQPKACQGFDQSWHLHPLSVFDQRDTHCVCHSGTQRHPEPWVGSDPDGETQTSEKPRSWNWSLHPNSLSHAQRVGLSKVPASFPTQRNPCCRSHPCLRPWQTGISLQAAAPSPAEAYKAGRGDLGDARRRVRKEARAPTAISIGSSVGRVFPEGMGEVEALAGGELGA